MVVAAVAVVSTRNSLVATVFGSAVERNVLNVGGGAGAVVGWKVVSLTTRLSIE